MDKLYRLYDGIAWNGGRTLDEIAVLMRIKEAQVNMEPELHKKAQTLRIDSVDCRPQELDIVDADRAAMDFISRHGLVAFMKKVIHMTIDETGPRANESYRIVTGKDMVGLGTTCGQCTNKQCANCPAFK